MAGKKVFMGPSTAAVEKSGSGILTFLLCKRHGAATPTSVCACRKRQTVRSPGDRTLPGGLVFQGRDERPARPLPTPAQSVIVPTAGQRKIFPLMLQRPKPRSLAAYTKATVGSAVALTAAGTSHAVVVFDVDPAKTIGVAGDPPSQTVSFTDINLTTGTYAGSIGYGPPISSGPTFWFTIPGENQFTAQGAGGMGLVGYIFPSNTLSLLPAGTVINATSKYISNASMSEGAWNGGGTGYVGLVLSKGTNKHYGWAALAYTENGPATALSVSGFAFEETPDTPILAGATAIPEPGTWAAGAGLFALAVGAHLRRRRAKKVAASDALLNLAGGARGVEKFRADRAA